MIECGRGYEEAIRRRHMRMDELETLNQSRRFTDEEFSEYRRILDEVCAIKRGLL